LGAITSNPNLRSGNGISTGGAIPILKSRIYIGLEASGVAFPLQKTQQLFSFSTDPITNTGMELRFRNSITKVFLTSKFMLKPEGLIRPYLNLSLGGLGFLSNVEIRDMNENDLYKPVKTELLSYKELMACKFGLGTRVIPDLPVYSDNAPFFILNYVEFGFFYSVGMGNVNIISPNPPSQQGSRPNNFQVVEAEFVNTETQAIRKQTVGYQYKSPISMLDFQVGIGFLIVNESDSPRKRLRKTKTKPSSNKQRVNKKKFKYKYKSPKKIKQPKNKKNPQPKRIYTN
jgi:hypothetical protein